MRIVFYNGVRPKRVADAGETRCREVAAGSRTLHAFYRAGLDAYLGDRDAWA